MAYERERAALGLDEYRVLTEATHWSGVRGGDGDPGLLTRYPVPMVDIEVGSDPGSWEDERACRALAHTLTQVFDDDGRRVHNILCVGGTHFEPSFAEAVFTTWGDEAFGITHILANQWLVSGGYKGESGLERAKACVNAIAGGVEAIFFHDKLKGCYKDLVRSLGWSWAYLFTSISACARPSSWTGRKGYFLRRTRLSSSPRISRRYSPSSREVLNGWKKRYFSRSRTCSARMRSFRRS